MRKAILLPAILLAACSNYSANLPSIKPYKMDVQQGNVVTPKMMMQLRPGMSKSQVRFIMGTPLIADSFHANRWDYFYRMQKDGRVIEQRRVILEFEDEQLKRVRGDVIPAGSGGETQTADRPASKAPVTLKSATDAPVKKEEKGMLDKLKFWKSDDEKAPAKPAPKPAEAVKPVAAEKPASQPLPEVPAKREVALPPLSEDAPAKPGPAPQPVTERQQPKEAPAPQPDEKGLLDKLKFWKSDEPAKTETPAAKVEPKAEPKPEPRKVEAKPEPKPEPRPAKPTPKAEPKPVPKPADDMPAEDDPSYFERMLEKIGF